MQEVQFITIAKDYINQRLDNYLIRYLHGIPKTRIYRAIRKGEVRVNKKRAEALYRLQEGDQIRIPPLQQTEKPRLTKPSTAFKDLLTSRIIFEDENLLIINKPSGVPVHGGTGLSGGLIENLRQILSYPYLELVHRLDKATSGCLVIAKKVTVLRELHQLLRENKMQKVYVALTLGHWPKAKDHVTLSLRKNKKISGERLVIVADDGRDSETYFKPLKYFTSATLVEARLITGRTHQIRVHCAQSGHPIAGDEKYGDKAFNKLMQKKGLKRLFLHAKSLKFQLPGRDKPIAVQAELDEDLEKILQNIETKA